MKIFESLIILTFLSFSAAAQKPEACRADVRHLKLPQYAVIDDVLGLSLPPLAFLFSQDGVDVYSATDFEAMKRMRMGGLPFANAFTVILVYQGEEIRQKKIESLRKNNPYVLMDDLKFATWRFELTPVWVDNVLMRKWLIAGTAYFKPMSCETPDPRNPSPLDLLEASINGRNQILGRMPPIEIPESQRIPPTPNSILARTLGVMRQELKSYGFPN
jgi:hypothetical protein